MINFRIGIGYDVHKFASDRKLFLGGIEIPSEKGLEGHSDADVLLHSICDALLGAASLGDIGKHFPNTDEKFKNISSLVLLEKVNELISSNGYLIGNIDATVLAEKPKLLPYIHQMKNKIAETLNLSVDQISIKATTNEKIGFVGREEGIAAISVALLYRQTSGK